LKSELVYTQLLFFVDLFPFFFEWHILSPPLKSNVQTIFKHNKLKIPAATQSPGGFQSFSRLTAICCCRFADRPAARAVRSSHSYISLNLRVKKAKRLFKVSPSHFK
jgi:hypothetical protein